MADLLRLRSIISVLSDAYKDPSLGNRKNPIDEIIFIILSEKTDEPKYRLAFQELKSHCPQWENLLSLPLSKIEARIKGAGMGRRRAQLIKRALRQIKKTFGRLDLASLKNMNVDDAEKLLCSLPGIGPKTARCILLYCFDQPVLPVDIHTYRIAVRLGLLSRRISYHQSHDVLAKIIPAELRRRFHVNAVAHGRARCFAEKPKCNECPLTQFCVEHKTEKTIKLEVRPRPFAVDLFAGAGGMSLGFTKSGFHIVQAVEVDPHAAKTYRKNHPETDVIESAIQKLNPVKCLARVGLQPGDISVLIGGPPCQGFSESNRRTRTLGNPRNHLYKHFVRFLKAIEPDWFVLENVAGLKTLAKGAILNRIVKDCRELGYKVAPQVLNAADYGVPQVRRRLFIVGNRLGLPIEWPKASHGHGKKSYVTVRQAIADLSSLVNGASEDYSEYPGLKKRFFKARLTKYQSLLRGSLNGSKKIQGNLVTKSAVKIIKRYKRIKAGQNWEAIPAKLMDNYEDRSRCHTGIYHRLKWNRPAKVIGNFRKNMLIHPRQHRGLSVREAARLQSFPDSYLFLGSIGFQQQQVADAVPPLLAQAVATAIKSAKTQMKRTSKPERNGLKVAA